MMRKVFTFVVFAVLFVSLVNAEPEIRCETDADCTELGSNYICKDNVCSKPVEQSSGKVQVVGCPEGFTVESDGSCVPSSVPKGVFCIDSDESIPETRGTVSYRASSESPIQKFNDFCDGDTLYEYYCDDIGPDEFDCTLDNKVCENGMCVYPIHEDPIFLESGEIKYEDYNLYLIEDREAHLIPNPKVFDEEKIFSYFTDLRYPSSPYEWMKIRPYDPTLCYSEVFDPDRNPDIKVRMELWLSSPTGSKKLQEMDAECDNYTGFKACYAEFDSTHDLWKAGQIESDRSKILKCNVYLDVGMGTTSLKTSNNLLVPREIYPMVVANGDGSSQTLSDFGIPNQYSYYMMISDLGDNIVQDFENPEFSSKVVLYAFSPQVEENDFMVDYNKFNFGYFESLLSWLKFDPSKGDRVVVYSGYVMDAYNKLSGKPAGGFTLFNNPIVYIGNSVVYYPFMLSHELGHSKPINLCDEYEKDFWIAQNNRLLGGCPNSFPEDAAEKIEVINQLFFTVSPIKDIIDTGGYVSMDPKSGEVSVIILPEGSMCQTEYRSGFLARWLGGDQSLIFSNPEECMETYVDKILESYGHVMDIRSHYVDGNQVALTFALKAIELVTSVMGSDNIGNYYPEVTHSHEKYCPLKEC